MAAIPADPVAAIGGIAAYGEALRRGDITAADATRAYLDRIAAYDGRLLAYEHVFAEESMAAAAAMDALLAAGHDLGPLMGVPVAVKDLFAVDGAPTLCGTLMDVSDLFPDGEGSFVRRLRRSGCVILGKTRTVEFALGGTGTNAVRGTPVNPWDAKTHRAPSGSSSGSGVATAAGLCAFSIGSDTGGSVRGPAAFCGTFGLKTSVGLWPTDGVFALSRVLDTIGPLTRTAADAALVFAVLCETEVPEAAALDGLRLGRPRTVFFDDMDDQVTACMDAAMTALSKAGAVIVDIDVPETPEVNADFIPMSSAELISRLGRERYLAHRDKMDPQVAARMDGGLELTSETWIRMLRRHEDLVAIARRRMTGLDGWITPGRQMVPPSIDQCLDPDTPPAFGAAVSRNARPANIFGQCATSTPIHQLGSDLPVALQIACNGGDDAQAMSIALALEGLLGEPPAPDLSGFTD